MVFIRLFLWNFFSSKVLMSQPQYNRLIYYWKHNFGRDINALVSILTKKELNSNSANSQLFFPVRVLDMILQIFIGTKSAPFVRSFIYTCECHWRAMPCEKFYAKYNITNNNDINCYRSSSSTRFFFFSPAKTECWLCNCFYHHNVHQ